MDSEKDIVISGISGRLPECENVEEFWQALFDGVDLMTIDSRRYPPGFLGTPKRLGKVNHTDRFDATFFNYPPKLANLTDPRHRILLETAYECIVDAGYNPIVLRGSKTGVYVAIANYLESEESKMLKTDGYYIPATYLSMAANRISYTFDFRGPSYVCDTACSSSIYVLSQALNDLKNGLIDYALIGGTHLTFSAFQTAEFGRLNMTSAEGFPRSFSADRDGFARSEGVVSIFLQRSQECRRAYATVIGAGTNCDGYKKEGISFPSYEMHLSLLQNVYKDFNINPDDVTYFEAHATGTQIGDLTECRVFTEFFCKTRKAPLPIGSVKSNMGHAELSSGLCSILKSLIIFRRGIIPGNLHSERIDTTLPGIRDGKLVVVNKNTPFNTGLIGISALGFGGANAHVVLKPRFVQTKHNMLHHNNRLVLASGRTPEAVDYFLDGIHRNRNDAEFLALVDEIHSRNIEGHGFRGYTLLGENSIRETGKFNGFRPVWFIYTGMGCQWTTMGRDLLKIETFKKTFDRCAQALEPFNIDLYSIVTKDDSTILDDIVHSICGISAIQIALTDVLFSMGIFPDRIAGHSLGEVGCAYADGTLTPEQAMLLGFSRGYSCRQTRGKLSKGMMAAVGLGKKEITNMLPDGVFIGCQNSSSNVTITGPFEVTKNFVQELQLKGIFAKIVKTSDYAFHSKYVEEAGKYLLKFVETVITDPKPRSSKWISTSVPPERQFERSAVFNCPEYHYNNFCNPVLFDQIFEHIPENAIVIEVAPHGLLQAILKRELLPTVTNLTLASRNSSDNEEFFLSAIGRFYLAGGEPQLRNFYREVKFPVSHKAATISSLVKWDHSISWLVPTCSMKKSFGEFIDINLNDDEWSYLKGYEVDGRILMPAMSYLLLVWKVFAKLLMKPIEHVPVIMEKISFDRATILVPNEDIRLYVNILRQSGIFEIFESNTLVASGSIKLLENYESDVESGEEYSDNDVITEKDFYKYCTLQKLNYNDEFRGVKTYYMETRKATIKWYKKFDCFLDAMLQLEFMNYLNTKGVLVTSFIEKLVVDPGSFMTAALEHTELEVTVKSKWGVIKCPGIEIYRPVLLPVAERQNIQVGTLLESQRFIPYRNPNTITTFQTALKITVDIILQNSTKFPRELSICQVFSNNFNDKLMKTVSEILSKEPYTFATILQKSVKEVSGKYDVILLEENLNTEISIADFLHDDAFIVYLGKFSEGQEKCPLEVVFIVETDNGVISLTRKLRQASEFNNFFIDIRNNNFHWIDELKTQIKDEKSKNIYLIDQSHGMNGVLGLANCLNKEVTNCKFTVIITDGIFSTESDIYRNQLKKNLIINVLKNNEWGTYVHVPLEDVDKREVTDAAVDIKVVGNLSSLDWVQTQTACYDCYENNDEVQIFYSALNFRDVMLALGKMQYFSPNASPSDPNIPLGVEFSGISGGKRVMGIYRFRGIALQRKMDDNLWWEVPNDWSLEDAATVPALYGTAYYALIICARIQPGESVLIHCGSGATGMAAISVALNMNCEVFTTVSTDEKKEFLKKQFPQLKDEHFGDSRNTSFENMIMERTNGRGVDVILSSLRGKLFEASIKCIAENGQYLELGKVEYDKRRQIDSYMFSKGCSFHAIVFDKLFDGRICIKKLIQELVTEGIRAGVVKPLPRRVFTETQVAEAFTFLGAGKNSGKVLIQIRKENRDNLTSPSRTITAIPRIFFNSQASYIITGGLGGVGLELADWMIQKGAKKLVLNSRRYVTNGYQRLCLRKWQQLEGIEIVVSTKDSSDANEARSLIEEAHNMGPVGGIFNLALVLRDKVFINQTEIDFTDVFRAKFTSVKNLDEISKKICPKLVHFVVFSSIASAFGNAGQTNYGMASSAAEMLCERRKSEGLPALAVQYGLIAGVGTIENWNHNAQIG